MKRAFALGLLVVAACASEPVPPDAASSELSSVDAGPAFSWPVPAGWRSETIPFPLGFAPSLPHRGTEELRFAPRFFDAKSPTYFTYAFAFVLEDAAPVTATSLAADLRTYFQGLASAVTHAPSDASLHDASIVARDARSFEGTIRTIDGFGDRRPLTLHLEASTFPCGARKTVVLAGLTPRTDDPIRAELARVRASFVCGK